MSISPTKCANCGTTENVHTFFRRSNQTTIYLCSMHIKEYEIKSETMDVSFLANPKVLEGVSLMLDGLSDQFPSFNRSDPELTKTPFRVARMLGELCSGYIIDPRTHLSTKIPTMGEQLIYEGAIPFNSTCIHHLAVISGEVHIGYIPNQYVVGLSKLARVVEGYAKRLQLQEQMTEQIVSAIDEELNPLGTMVIVRATHDCMQIRGINKQGTLTTTSAVRGIFKTNDAGCKDEFLALLKGEI